MRRYPGYPGRFPEKGRFFSVAFDEMDLGHAKHAKHQARKAGAAPHIDDNSGVFRKQREKLGRIEKVTPPGVLQTGLADQIEALLPVLEQPEIGLQASECFT